MLLWLSFFVPVFLCGQTPSPSAIDHHLQQGHVQWAQGRYDSAYVHFVAARTQAFQIGDTVRWSMARYLVGKYLMRYKQDFRTAEAVLDSVLALEDHLDPLGAELFLARRERANLEVYRGNLPEALRRYEDLIETAEKFGPDKDSLRAMAYEAMGQANVYYDDFERALHFSNKALELRKQIYPPDHLYLAFTENTLGGIYSWTDRYATSLQHYQNAERILLHHFRPTHPNVVQIRTNLGVVHADLGLYWESIAYHRENLALLDSLSPPIQLGVLLNLASVLRVVEDFAEALSLLDQAENLLNQYPDLTPDNRAFVEDERSTIYLELNQAEKARFHIQQALQQNRALFGEDHPRLIGNYQDLAQVYAQLDQPARALEAIEQGQALAAKHLEAVSMRSAKNLLIKGEILAQNDQAKAALQSWQQANQIFAQIAPRHQAEVYRQMAVLWRETGRWDSTLVAHQKAWKALMPELPFQLAPDKQASSYWSEVFLASCLEEQGHSLRQQYAQTEELLLLEAALAAYQQSLAVVDSQRHYYEHSGENQLARQQQLSLYEATIAVAIQLWELTQNNSYLNQAFQLSEKSKAAGLRDHLRRRQAMQFAGVPDSLVQKEQYFRQRLAALDAARFDAEQAEPSPQNERYALKNAYEAFLSDLAQSYPHYYQLKYGARSPDIATVQAQLSPKQVAYSYFMGEEGVYIFRIAPEEATGYLLENRDQLQSDLQNWIAFVSQAPSAQAPSATLVQTGQALGEKLLPQLPLPGTSLLIIPGGILGYLPFESLLLETPTDLLQYQRWHYLGQSFTLSYAYAAEIWLQGKQSQQKASAYLGFAPDFSTGLLSETRSAWGALTHNQEEVEAAARLFAGKALTGEQAQESAVKQLSTRSNILHFATHALGDNESELDSYLQLSQNSDHNEDGRLHTYEIYGLSLNSPLTVLSACQTANGPLLEGEGIMSLARAFQYAGSEQVLTTLWKADDQAGASLTTAFLTAVAEGEGTATALQAARQQWLSEADNVHGHPYYWAGFVLMGDGGEIETGKRGWLWWFSGGMIVLGLGIWVIRRNRRG